MEPLFSASCDLVGWITVGKAIWDNQMAYVAYIAGDHAWSSETDAWLGPVDGTTCMDRSGRPVAWSPARAVGGRSAPIAPARPMRPARPMTPMRPIAPRRPLFPATPGGGWSQLDFGAWLAG
ncbi:hypothetical protein OPKNFCMD_3770 [Methylobacterium crusticola]|uniref:4-fold beta flower domain-containing protein n=1 Tax=Methylobacterium crusticola TaxID=1697972 RepID=A0ABQ4R2C0_9HYPH|nr:hypothetical protein [Methylobacterium crusticola]GJD51019.1 hypothetical protein OPKNFCMD_3770 [Methylobacterium crusticola]